MDKKKLIFRMPINKEVGILLKIKKHVKKNTYSLRSLIGYFT